MSVNSADIPPDGKNAGPRIKILHEPCAKEPFAVIVKPRGLPSAPLRQGDDSAYTQAARLYPILDEVQGRKAVEHGLLHRLDTDTEGLLLLAADQDFHDAMLAFQAEGKFIKTYTADCQIEPDCTRRLGGFPANDAGIKLETLLTCMHKYTVSSEFRFFGPGRKSVRPVTGGGNSYADRKASGTIYSTRILTEQTGPGTVRATCVISAGFRHQVRCHLAWLGLPVRGDRIYNPGCGQGDFLHFWASGIEFPDPAGSGKLSFRMDVPA